MRAEGRRIVRSRAGSTPRFGWYTDPVDFYLAGYESKANEQRRETRRHEGKGRDDSSRGRTGRSRKDAASDHALAFQADMSSIGADGLGDRDRAATDDALHARLLREMPATDELGEHLALDILRAGYVVMPTHNVSRSLAAREARHSRLLRTLTQVTGSRIVSSVESTAIMLDHLRYRLLVTLRLPGPVEEPSLLHLSTDRGRQEMLAPRLLLAPLA